MQSTAGEIQEVDPAGDKTEETNSLKQAAPKMKISLEKYQSIALSIVRYLRQQEEAALTINGGGQADDDEDEPEGFRGLPQSEVVQWYLDQNSGEFESEETVEYERALVNKVFVKLYPPSLKSRFSCFTYIFHFAVA
jgi:hypothetical protein